MEQIRTVIVDDSDADRYIARRVLSRAGGFRPIDEEVTGDAFLSAWGISHSPAEAAQPPLLVLMDINMPGRDGFQTIETLQERLDALNSADGVIVVMCTSSSYIGDKQRAANLPLVRGFLTKPLSQPGIDQIRTMYEEEAAA